MKQSAIAIVDDDQDDLEFLVAAFQSVGISMSIDAYSNGKAFLEEVMIEKALPLLTVLDYNMPYYTGEAVLIEMSKHPDFSGTKVIVLSTGMHSALEKRLTELGAYCCILKPNTESGYKELALLFKKTIDDLQQGKEADLHVFDDKKAK